MTNHEQNRFRDALLDTGGWYSRVHTRAVYLFMTGHSIDRAISLARSHFGF